LLETILGKEATLVQKWNNPKLETQIINLIMETAMPCSIDYVAKHFDLAWGTARAILLILAVGNKVHVKETTTGLVFWKERGGSVKINKPSDK
jgi:hypothetical protein